MPGNVPQCTLYIVHVHNVQCTQCTMYIVYNVHKTFHQFEAMYWKHEQSFLNYKAVPRRTKSNASKKKGPMDTGVKSNGHWC